MKNLPRKGVRTLSTVAVLAAILSLFNSNPAYASYYPSGIQQNISEQTLIDNGWTLFYEETYSTANSSTGSEFRPSGSLVIVTGKTVGSNILTTVAAAPTNDVFTQTVLDTPQLINGTYWYYTPGWSFGYSPTNVILQESADTTGCDDMEENANACASDPSRLSWHLSGSGGYRLGNAGWINNDFEGGNLYLKQIWTRDAISVVQVRQNSNLTFAQSLYASDTLSDPDGELRKTVDSINSKYGNLIK
jgi:hypothetical protein